MSDESKKYVEFRRRIGQESSLDYKFPISEQVYETIVNSAMGIEGRITFEFEINRDVLFLQPQYDELFLHPKLEVQLVEVSIAYRSLDINGIKAGTRITVQFSKREISLESIRRAG